jgi:hypothetical protein
VFLEQFLDVRDIPIVLLQEGDGLEKFLAARALRRVVEVVKEPLRRIPMRLAFPIGIPLLFRRWPILLQEGVEISWRGVVTFENVASDAKELIILAVDLKLTAIWFREDAAEDFLEACPPEDMKAGPRHADLSVSAVRIDDLARPSRDLAGRRVPALVEIEAHEMASAPKREIQATAEMPGCRSHRKRTPGAGIIACRHAERPGGLERRFCRLAIAVEGVFPNRPAHGHSP